MWMIQASHRWLGPGRKRPPSSFSPSPPPPPPSPPPQDGVTYDRSAIEEWFETTKEVIVSPQTLEPMTKELTTNFRLAEEIKAYKKAKIHLAAAGDSSSESAAWMSPT